MNSRVMNGGFGLTTLIAGLFLIPGAFAQTPAGSTGQCKDGTYTTAPKKAGACSGHKGVASWYAANGTMPAPGASSQSAMPAASASQSAPASAPQSAPASTSLKASPAASRAQAPGNGPGMVWVNTASKVYHCSGTEYYGKTKSGKYVSEADAKAEGDRPDHGKACGQ